MKLRRLQVYCMTKTHLPRMWLYHGGEFDKFYADIEPAFGTYTGKMTVENFNPAASEPLTWTLADEGAPATWLPGFTPP